MLVAVLASLGVDASNPAAISKSLLETECRQREQLVPPTVLAITGRANNVPLRCSADALVALTLALEDGTACRANVVPLRCSADALVALTLALEDGTAYAGDLRGNLCTHKDADFGEQLELTLPDDLPIGYHTLNVQVGGVQRRATVIVAPPRIELPEAVRQRQRWGWMTQMYSVRQRHLYPAAGHPRIRGARRRDPRAGRGAARLGGRRQ